MLLLSQDTVPIIMSGFVLSLSDKNSAFLFFSDRQFRLTILGGFVFSFGNMGVTVLFPLIER